MMGGFGSCVLTDSGATAMVNFAYSAINTAVEAGADWTKAVRRQTGAVW
jgi:hypothetical protein